MRTPNEYKYIEEGQFRRMADKYTVDELRGAYLLELPETLKVGDRIEIQRPRVFSIDEIAKMPAGFRI
jgi:hypothetical protein